MDRIRADETSRDLMARLDELLDKWPNGAYPQEWDVWVRFVAIWEASVLGLETVREPDERLTADELVILRLELL